MSEFAFFFAIIDTTTTMIIIIIIIIIIIMHRSIGTPNVSRSQGSQS